MYDGQNPPEYKRQASHPDLAHATRGAQCHTCTRPKKSDGGHTPHHDCNKCGKKKILGLSPIETQVAPIAVRSVSEGATVPLLRPEQLERASTGPELTARRVCHKCGKAKRPVSAGDPPAVHSRSSPEGRSTASPVPKSHIASQHVLFGGSQPSGLKIMVDVPRRKPVAGQTEPEGATGIDIDVIPPTATSERPQPNILTEPNIEGSPLLESSGHRKTNSYHRGASISSISSSISRSLSKGRKHAEGSPEGSPLGRSGENSENGAGRLINMITSAIRGNESPDYARLEEHERRPDSPFSFVETTMGEEVLELKDMSHSRSDSKNSWDKVEYSASLSGPFEPVPYGYEELPKRPEHLRVRSEHADRDIESPLAEQEDVFLADPSQRPGINRFKSLRDGVSRASSVARSTSLKRLNSLKNAPQYWYRTDMAIEGAVDAY